MMCNMRKIAFYEREETMRVIDIENINYAMRNEVQFVLRCEEVFRDKLSSAVCTILSAEKRPHVVALTGPSGSGKTTTALRLKEYFENLGVKVCMLSMDNFFIPLAKRPREVTDWESPLCVDIPQLHGCIRRLTQGELVDIPVYDFITGETSHYVPMQGDKDAIIIAEGIHMLNPLIFDAIRDIAIGVYVAPRTRIITEQDHIIKPQALRVMRRMLRDYQNRGHSLRDTVIRSESVDRGEVQYIQPHKGNAAIHIDTFHDYEPCILAKYLRELPECREELTEEFMNEHNLGPLLHVVNSIPPLHTEYVPKDSIVREFVGGSCYEY